MSPEFSYSDQFHKFFFLTCSSILTKLNSNSKHISIVPLGGLTGKLIHFLINLIFVFSIFNVAKCVGSRVHTSTRNNPSLCPGKFSSTLKTFLSSISSVATVQFNEMSHAMVLDAIEFEDNGIFFVFKNTNSDNKQVRINTGKARKTKLYSRLKSLIIQLEIFNPLKLIETLQESSITSQLR